MSKVICPNCGANLESRTSLQVDEVVNLDAPHGPGSLCGGFRARVVQDEHGELTLQVLED